MAAHSPDCLAVVSNPVMDTNISENEKATKRVRKKMIKYLANSSPAHLLSPTPFHSSEQEKIRAGHAPASL